MVPKPVAAVLLLFPVTEATEAARKAEQGACAIVSYFPAWHALMLAGRRRLSLLLAGCNPAPAVLYC